MYTPINGWTKQKMLAVIEARPFDEPAVLGCPGGRCVYRTSSGNRCGIGMFIPVGHRGEGCVGNIETLLIQNPDLRPLMPLNHLGLMEFQLSHDRESRGNAQHHGNAKKAMIAWIEENVKGTES